MVRADIHHLLRGFRRSAAGASAAILTLSLTLGAGASILAVVDAVLLTPPPFAEADRLASVGEVPIDRPAEAPRPVPAATFEAWRERAVSLAGLEAVDATNLTLTGLGPAERLSASDVTPGFLALLGVAPALGRAFAPDDQGRPVVIVSHSLWRSKFAADPFVVGRSIVLGGQAHTVIGVLPERFAFELNLSDVWRPLPALASQAARAGSRMAVLARLAPGVSPRTLEHALEEVSRASSPPARVSAVPVAEAISGGATRMLGLLGGAAALAALVGFVNFSGLLFVRSIDRRRELAIRSALGANRWEIARQLLLEAQALVAAGVAGGLVLATWLVPGVGRLAVGQAGGVAGRQLAMTWPVAAAIAVAASVCAGLSALVPAFGAARRDALGVLRQGATPAVGELRWRRVLVAGQVALGFVLLACVTLLAGSLVRLLGEDAGFDARGAVALQVSVPAATYDDQRAASFYRALQGALEERLGPGSAADVNEIPLTGDGGRSVVARSPGDAGCEAVVREASPSYFEVMRVPVLAGRAFGPRDDDTAPRRVVVSQSFASALFPHEESVGRQLWFANSVQPVEIVGVVGDVRHRALDERVVPTVYRSALQVSSRSRVVVVRSGRPVADVVGVVREEVARLDANVPVYRVRALQDVVAASPGVPARRILAVTFAGFGLLALALGAIGLFGVVAQDVASRRTELALRMALGADSKRVVAAVLRQNALTLGAGLAAGGLLSAWAARALGAAGFSTGRLDPPSVWVPVATLVAAGAIAVLPALGRALRTDPLAALRNE